MSLHENQELTLTIEQIGGLGDGIARYEGRTVFVPFTSIGDVVRAQIDWISKDGARASVREIIIPGSARQAAPCVHFGHCGGCSLQHLNADTYREFKSAILRNAVNKLGYDASCMSPLVEVGAHSRRRAELTLQVNKGNVRLGFLMPRSHQLIDLEMCPVMEEVIFAIAAPFKAWACTLKKPQHISSISITRLDDGLELLLHLREKLSPAEQESLRHFGESEPGILRIGTQAAEQRISRIFSRGPAMIRLGAATVELPEGAFLQASAKGQETLTELVVKHTDGAKRIADIYSGCGTYSFPLVGNDRHVHAYEGSADMVMAAQSAARRAGMESLVEFETRDLFRRPLNANELAKFDAVVINPPRNGAEPQMQQLAKSGVERTVIVSCNPATFERDAIGMKRAGYALVEATPVDQFVWSPHLELVAAFRKLA